MNVVSKHQPDLLSQVDAELKRSSNPNQFLTLKAAKDLITKYVKTSLYEGISGLEISAEIARANERIFEQVIKNFFPRDVVDKYGVVFLKVGGTGHGRSFLNSDLDLTLVINDSCVVRNDGEALEYQAEKGEKTKFTLLDGTVVEHTYMESTTDEKIYSPKMEPFNVRKRALGRALASLGFLPEEAHINCQLISDFTPESKKMVGVDDLLTYFTTRSSALFNRENFGIISRAFTDLGQTPSGILSPDVFIQTLLEPRRDIRTEKFKNPDSTTVDVKYTPGFWRSAQFTMILASILNNPERQRQQMAYSELSAESLNGIVKDPAKFLKALDLFATLRHALSLDDQGKDSTLLTPKKSYRVAELVGRSRISHFEEAFDLQPLPNAKGAQRLLRVVNIAATHVLHEQALAREKGRDKTKNLAEVVLPPVSTSILENIWEKVNGSKDGFPWSQVENHESISADEILLKLAVAYAKHNQKEALSESTYLAISDLLTRHNYQPPSPERRDSNQILLGIYADPQILIGALRFMQHTGCLDLEFPYLKDVRGVVEIESRHDFNLYEHSIKTVEGLAVLLLHPDLKSVGFIRPEFGLIDLRPMEITGMLCAAQSHDIGKSRTGSGPGHIDRGVERTQDFFRSLGLESEPDLREAELLVKFHHLLRRDNARPFVELIEELKEDRVANDRFLYKLYLLTIADLLATKKEPDYYEIQAINERYSRTQLAMKSANDLEVSFRGRARIASLLSPDLAHNPDLVRLLQSLPEDFVSSARPESAVSILEILAEARHQKDQGAVRPVIVRVEAEDIPIDGGVQANFRVRVAGLDQPGVLATILSAISATRVYSLKGVSINGLAADEIWFCRDNCGINEGDLTSVENSITRALNTFLSTENPGKISYKKFSDGRYDLQARFHGHHDGIFGFTVHNCKDDLADTYTIIAALSSLNVNITQVDVGSENEKDALRIKVRFRNVNEVDRFDFISRLRNHLGDWGKMSME